MDAGDLMRFRVKLSQCLEIWGRAPSAPALEAWSTAVRFLPYLRACDALDRLVATEKYRPRPAQIVALCHEHRGEIGSAAALCATHGCSSASMKGSALCYDHMTIENSGNPNWGQRPLPSEVTVARRMRRADVLADPRMGAWMGHWLDAHPA